MRLRLRFPDGRSAILSDLPGTLSLRALRARAAEEAGCAVPPRLVVAGPPPRALDGHPSDAAIGGLVEDGDSVYVVIGAASGVAEGSGAVGRGRGRGRGRVTGRGGSGGRGGRGGAVAKAGRRKASAFRGVGKGAVLGTGEEIPGEGEAPRLRMEDVLGGKILDAVAGVGGKESKSFRAALTEEKREREKQSAGQRRFESVASNKFDIHYYQFPGEETLVFKARYKGVGEKAWKTDPEPDDEFFGLYSRRVVAAIIREVLAEIEAPDAPGGLEGKEEWTEKVRSKLRPAGMARTSPRVFWNIVCLFKARFEGEERLSFDSALKELVPDADWTFLTERRRKLSAKAKANAEMKRQGYDV